LLSAIQPAGLYSNELSDKDRGVVISPRMDLQGDEEVWMRVRGSGNSVVRYSVQNYPRNGTVFPSTDLKNGLLGICFWRKVREERVWTEFIGEKGGWSFLGNNNSLLPITNAIRAWCIYVVNRLALLQ
jgi:hypothetical protein